jgi:hypothetical protein
MDATRDIRTIRRVFHSRAEHLSTRKPVQFR